MTKNAKPKPHKPLNTTYATIIIMKCFRCGYNWPTRIDNPKSCPRCKTRLDYNIKKVRINGY